MERINKLPLAFYRRKDVVSIARELLGKQVFTFINKELTGGIITETEAYNGEFDRASHAFGGKRTERTEVMYRSGGVVYVYLCYGIHSLLNVVTNTENIPHAVLIRAIYPTHGLTTIQKRRKKVVTDFTKLCVGPGTVSQALGIHYKDSGESLISDKIWITDSGIPIPKNRITVGPRVGVDYAGKDALLPYRFRVLHSDEHFLNRVKLILPAHK